MCMVVGFCFGSWKYCLLLLELWFLWHKKNLAPTPLVPHSPIQFGFLLLLLSCSLGKSSWEITHFILKLTFKLLL